jgi:hypothetical protein
MVSPQAGKGAVFAAGNQAPAAVVRVALNRRIIFVKTIRKHKIYPAASRGKFFDYTVIGCGS